MSDSQKDHSHIIKGMSPEEMRAYMGMGLQKKMREDDGISSKFTNIYEQMELAKAQVTKKDGTSISYSVIDLISEGKEIYTQRVNGSGPAPSFQSNNMTGPVKANKVKNSPGPKARQ